ncbi:MAG: hypothetical protein ACI4J1_07510 [Ruminiclostridium sp.]
MKGKVFAVISIIWYGAILALFFVPAVFLSDIIFWKTDWLVLVYVAFMAALYGFALISKSRLQALFKWLASLPFAYLAFQYFWSTKYALRSLNWVFPGYGKQSAGGAFASMGITVLFGILCIAAFVIALFMKPRNFSRFKKIQLCLCTAAAVCIVIVTLTLEKQFPPYPVIFG